MGAGEWIVLLLVLATAVAAVDRLLRRGFHQRGDRTVGARQRDPQTSWRAPTGEVIDELTQPGNEPPTSDDGQRSP